jgi:hypothetical protein
LFLVLSMYSLYTVESEIFNTERARMRATPVMVPKSRMERGMKKYNIIYKYETRESDRNEGDTRGCARRSAYISRN